MCADQHRYEYDIDLDGPTAQATVIKMVGRDKRVLDIGAGPGSIAKLLQQERGCRVTAVEIDPSAIKILHQYCERVFQADLNESSWVELLKGEDPFEVVVVADVFEHLYDPWSTLQGIKTLIAPNGYVVASLPHVGHTSIHACLFNEDFSYKDWGLLDSTHIRFFGLKNMQMLFEDAGYEIIDAALILHAPKNDVQFSSQWDALPAKFKAAIKLNKFSNVYQVVIKAKPSDAPGKGLQLMSLGAAHAVVMGKTGWFKTLKLQLKNARVKMLTEKISWLK